MMNERSCTATRVRALILGIVLLLGASGCTTTQVIKANPTPARHANDQLPTSLLLDIGVLPFDPNIPPDADAGDKKQTVIPDVRKAESQYIAYHLKDTLELTGNWGAVRVIPEPSEAVDLTISGKILLSDGESLRAHITAVDSSGRVWIDKDYKDAASKFSYDKTRVDPFQDFYNKIANDLLDYREKLPQNELANIRQISSLKFARDLSPDAFDKYLTERGGRTRIKQLPAKGSKMLARVDKIKQREYRFIDTLDDYYGNFYREMKPSYDAWRRATYEDAMKLRMMQAQSRNRILGGVALIAGGIYASNKSETSAEQAASVASVIGGIGTLKSGLDRRAEAQIHEQSLREESQSLGSEITPYVLNIEGRTIELKGTADAQYKQWRKILRQIYAEETGLPVK